MQVYFNIPIHINQKNATRKQNKKQYEYLNHDNIFAMTSHDLFFGLSANSKLPGTLVAQAKKSTTILNCKTVLQRSSFLDQLFPKENFKGIDDEDILFKKMNDNSSEKSIIEKLTEALEDNHFKEDENVKLQKLVIEHMFLKGRILDNDEIRKDLNIVSNNDLNKIKAEAYKKLVKIFKKKHKQIKHKKSEYTKQIKGMKLEFTRQINHKYKDINKSVAIRLIQIQYLFPDADLKEVKTIKELKQKMKKESIVDTLNKILEEKNFSENEKRILRMWFGLNEKKPLSILEIRDKLKIDKVKYLKNTRDEGIYKLKKILEENNSIL